jgi:uncharacterized membrane protein (UPF0127 family)
MKHGAKISKKQTTKIHSRRENEERLSNVIWPSLKEKKSLKRDSKTFKLIVAVVASVLLCIIICAQFATVGSSSNRQSSAKIKGSFIDLQVAATKKEQRIGLTGRDQLPSNSGMIFVFRPAKKFVNFWMVGTKIPLDLIFIRDGKIKTIYADARPPDENETVPKRYGASDVSEVIEVNSGYCASHHILIGDAAELNLNYEPKLLQDYWERLSDKIRLLETSINLKFFSNHSSVPDSNIEVRR